MTCKLNKELGMLHKMTLAKPNGVVENPGKLVYKEDRDNMKSQSTSRQVTACLEAVLAPTKFFPDEGRIWKPCL